MSIVDCFFLAARFTMFVCMIISGLGTAVYLALQKRSFLLNLVGIFLLIFEFVVILQSSAFHLFTCWMLGS